MLQKIFNNLLIFILISFIFSCQSGSSVKENNPKKNTSSTVKTTAPAEHYPHEVINLILPDGWSDDVLLKIAEGNDIGKPVMAIVNFENNAELKLNVSDLGLTDMLTTALFNTAKFDLVEREKIDLVFDEQNLANSEDFEPKEAARIGALLGANYILTGKITSAVRDIQDKYSHYELTASLTLDLRAINTTTGKIFKSIQASGSNMDVLVVDDRGNVIKGPAEFRNAMIQNKGETYTLAGVNMAKQFVSAAKNAIKQLSDKIEASFPLIGYVLSNDDTKIMTDIGSNRGAKKDDYLIVVHLGQDIIHPATKKVIGKEKTVIASAKIESVGAQESYAKLIKVKSPEESPKSGDVVISISSKFESAK